MSERVGILIVDDDEAVRGLARVILQHEGWQVVEAGSLREAGDTIRRGELRPHIAVVDLLLPDGLGTELAEDLRRARNKSRIVYITGDPGWLRKLNAGSEHVLAKPFTPVQLVVTVRAALETLKPVVVFVESGLVYRRLILSALVPICVEVVMASSVEKGLLLARQREAAVLFTPSSSTEGGLAELLELRKALPGLEVIALDAGPLDGDSRWYDSRLLRSYSVQEVADAVRHALSRLENLSLSPSEWGEMHQDANC